MNVSEVSGVSGENVAAPAAGKKKGKVLKYVLRGLAVVVLALGVAQVQYTASGDKDWQFVTEQYGIKVYSMKVPGQNVKKFMGVFEFKGTLSQVVSFIIDQESKTDDGGFSDSRLLEREGPQIWWQYWKTRLPPPMTMRDYVVKHQIVQDPTSKEVLYTLTAKPYMRPIEDCCVRVIKMDNSWRLTPRGSDNIEVHWTLDMDIGGWAPYFLVNKWFTWEVPTLASGLQEAVTRKKYVGAQLDWIENY